MSVAVVSVVPWPGGVVAHASMPLAATMLRLCLGLLPSQYGFCGFVLAYGFPRSEWFWLQIPLFPFPK